MNWLPKNPTKTSTNPKINKLQTESEALVYRSQLDANKERKNLYPYPRTTQRNSLGVEIRRLSEEGNEEKS